MLDGASFERELIPVSVRRARAFGLALLLFLAAPLMTVARAASVPFTPGERMSATFSTWSKKVDPEQRGVAIAATPLPPPHLQASNEPAPPKAPPAAGTVLRLWTDRQGARKKTVRRPR
jgi:hypothetical protein